MGATPFALVYGADVLLPIEVKIPTLWISMKGLITDDDYRISKLQELVLLDEHWQVACDHLQAYQQRMSWSYNKTVKPHSFQLGDLVLRENPKNQQQRTQKGKFEPNWLGPYIIIAVFGSGAYQLSTLKGEVLKEPINTLHLNQFYSWFGLKRLIYILNVLKKI